MNAETRQKILPWATALLASFFMWVSMVPAYGPPYAGAAQISGFFCALGAPFAIAAISVIIIAVSGKSVGRSWVCVGVIAISIVFAVVSWLSIDPVSDFRSQVLGDPLPSLVIERYEQAPTFGDGSYWFFSVRLSADDRERLLQTLGTKKLDVERRLEEMPEDSIGSEEQWLRDRVWYTRPSQASFYRTDLKMVIVDEQSDRVYVVVKPPPRDP